MGLLGAAIAQRSFPALVVGAVWQSIGIVTLGWAFLGFLVGILSQFPGSGIEATQPSQTATVDEFTELVKEAPIKFSFAYTQVIEDLESYLDDPDPQRAERQREAMADYANSLIPQFESLADSLQEKLDGPLSLAVGNPDD